MQTSPLRNDLCNVYTRETYVTERVSGAHTSMPFAQSIAYNWQMYITCKGNHMSTGCLENHQGIFTIQSGAVSAHSHVPISLDNLPQSCLISLLSPLIILFYLVNTFLVNFVYKQKQNIPGWGYYEGICVDF